MSKNSKNSFKNRNELEKYENARCFYCNNNFKVSEINKFIDDEQTALCPVCSCDSVLPIKFKIV